MKARGWLSAIGLYGAIAGVHFPLRQIRCDGTTYREYTLGDRVAASKPLLRDLFEGRAQLAPPEEVGLTFTSPGVTSFDVKVAMFRVAHHPGHYAFIRGWKADTTFAIFLMRSLDHGRTFRELGNLTAFNNDPARYDNQYDPTVTVDHDTCPPTYRVTAECSSGPTGEVDVCESHSQSPLDLASWSRAVPLVTGDNARHSGSTGALLLDPIREAGRWRTRRYVKWTDVQNATGRVTTAVARNDNLSTVGRAGNVGHTVLDADPYPCRGEWDCNNRDGQDWKREGDQYFIPYNGANYYGCGRTSDNLWGLSLARAVGNPLGPYTRLAKPLLLAARSDVCGISYPYVNVIDGQIWIYYAARAAGGPPPGTPVTVRSRIRRSAWP